jgi:hypothetical protein
MNFITTTIGRSAASRFLNIAATVTAASDMYKLMCNLERYEEYNNGPLDYVEQELEEVFNIDVAVSMLNKQYLPDGSMKFDFLVMINNNVERPVHAMVHRAVTQRLINHFNS